MKTIDEILREVLGVKPHMTTQRMEYAKAELAKIMASERLDEQKHSKRNGYIVAEKMHKVDRRISELEGQARGESQ